MKIRITADIPDRTKLLAGLTPREAHPPLVRAEEAAAAAEQALERARRELAEHERICAAMPARVQAGQVRASALDDALRARDARALLVGSAEHALATARERVAAEERNAAVARSREIDRRMDALVRTENELAAALAEIDDLALALARLQDPRVIGRACAACVAAAPHEAKRA